MILSVMLLLGGLVCLMLEVFLVSFGALGLSAAGLATAGIITAFGVSRALGWTMVVSTLVGGPTALWLAFRLLPKMPFSRGFFLPTPEPRPPAPPPGLLGATGVSVSPLRPSGTARIADQLVDVVTDGRMVPSGRPVKVVEVSGNRVVVAELPAATS